MKRKNKIYDKLEIRGSFEQQREIAKERLERLKQKDLSFLGYGIKKTIKQKIKTWIKIRMKWLMNKVQIFQK